MQWCYLCNCPGMSAWRSVRLASWIESFRTNLNYRCAGGGLARCSKSMHSTSTCNPLKQKSYLSLNISHENDPWMFLKNSLEEQCSRHYFGHLSLILRSRYLESAISEFPLKGFLPSIYRFSPSLFLVSEREFSRSSPREKTLGTPSFWFPGIVFLVGVFVIWHIF